MPRAFGEQELRLYAWRSVHGVPEGRRDEYRDLIRRFPSMIHHNGLGQALSFLVAKATSDGEIDNGDVHYLLYRHLEQWLCGEHELGRVYDVPAECEGRTPLLARLVHDPRGSGAYRLAKTRARDLVDWLKIFAEGPHEG